MLTINKVSGYTMKGSKNNVRFEMELTRLESLQGIFVVRFKRLGGETWPYKEMCSKVLNSMRL